MRPIGKAKETTAALVGLILVNVASAQVVPPAGQAQPVTAAYYVGKVSVAKQDGAIGKIVLMTDETTRVEVRLDDKGKGLAAFDGKMVEVLGLVVETDTGEVLAAEQVKEVTTVPPLAPRPDEEMTYIGTIQVTREAGAVRRASIVIDGRTSYDLRLSARGLKLAALEGKKVEVVGVLRKANGGLLLTAHQGKEIAGTVPAAAPTTGARYPIAAARPGETATPAPAGALDKTVSVSYKEASLDFVCKDLSAKAGVPVTCIGVFADKKVTYTADKAALGKVIDDIAAQIGSKLYERDGGFRFRRPD